MKVLIIRFSSIGDIVLTTPVIRCIKKQLPKAEIHYLTKYSYREIVDHNPYITKVHYLKDDLSAIIPQLKNEKFDFVADLHNNFRSWYVRMLLGRRSNVPNKLNFEKWLFVTFKWNLLPEIHLVDRYLETVRSLGVRDDGKGLDYFISSRDEIRIEDLPLTHLHGYVGVVIGAKHATKKLPIEKLATLCEKLPYPIILLGGPEDHAAGEEIRQQEPLKIFNGCGIYTLNQSASIVRQAKLIVTHDTGLMHIAAAFRKKIISVWGNTVPQFGMYPYFGKKKSLSGDSRSMNESRIIEVNNLGCRPCSKIGFSKCPRRHFKCMRLIDEMEIIELAKQ